jgi:ankyrin repeat protein
LKLSSAIFKSGVTSLVFAIGIIPGGISAGRDNLSSAVTRGDIRRAEQLIAGGADLDSRGRQGWTPLMIAADRGDMVTVKALIKAGADVNAVSPNIGFTALMAAVYQGHDDIAMILLKAGADPNARTKNIYSYCSDTPLILAIKREDPRMVSALISSGADIKARDEHGRTPLMYAVSYHQPAVVEILVNAGGDRKAADEEGLTLKNWAAIRGSH